MDQPPSPSAGRYADADATVDKLTPMLARVSLGKREARTPGLCFSPNPLGETSGGVWDKENSDGNHADENEDGATAGGAGCHRGGGDDDAAPAPVRRNVGPTPHGMRELKREQQVQQQQLQHDAALSSSTAPPAGRGASLFEPTPVLVITARSGGAHDTGDAHQESTRRLEVRLDRSVGERIDDMSDLDPPPLQPPPH